MAELQDGPAEPTGPSKAELLQAHRLQVIDSHLSSAMEDSAVEVCLQVCVWEAIVISRYSLARCLIRPACSGHLAEERRAAVAKGVRLGPLVQSGGLEAALGSPTCGAKLACSFLCLRASFPFL